MTIDDDSLDRTGARRPVETLTSEQRAAGSLATGEAVGRHQPPNAEAPAHLTPTPPDIPDVSTRYIWMQVIAQFGVFVAFITPLGISLAIKVAQLAPGQEQYLGYITGAGAFAVMIASPLLGQLSDRTRTRIGRRRPFMIAGMLLGIVALTVMAQSTSILILGVGWVMTQLTWGQVLGNLQYSQADKLPEHQRGKVAGLTGFATQVAPVLGVGVASFVSGNNLLLFLIPGFIGLLLTTLFVVFVHEEDSRGLTFDQPMTVLGTFRGMVFDPREHPDYAWAWFGRFLFYFGLTLNTTFTAFFFAQRLGVAVEDVAPTLAVLSLMGIVALSLGAIGGGFLSDRFHRRRAFVLLAGILFGAGAVTMAFAPSLPLLFAGSLVTSIGLGMFSAVDMALALDVLPDRAQAGRYMAIMNFAAAIPQAVAPLIAPSILALGATAAVSKNYPLLYIVAAVFTVAGGAVVLRIRSVK